MRTNETWLPCLLVLLLAACTDTPVDTPAARIDGRVSYVLDGDSIKFETRTGRELEVRLAGIDAPEHKQAHADESRAALKRLLRYADVHLISQGHDRYGRELATLHRGELNINRELVRLGHAWAYTGFAQDERLGVLQQDAEAARRGLWSNEAPIPPWEWRKTHPVKRTGHQSRR